MISHMAGFWARLFGRNNDPRSTVNAATPDSPPPRRTTQNPNDNLVEVRRGERWEEVVEVSGEAQFRRSFQKIFMTLGRPEGGVTFQDARLIPTRKGIIGVQIMGETVGYLDDDEDFYVATVKRGRMSSPPCSSSAWMPLRPRLRCVTSCLHNGRPFSSA